MALGQPWLLLELPFLGGGATPCGIWDLSSLSRAQTHAPCSGGTVLITGPPGKSLNFFFFLSFLTCFFPGGSVVKNPPANAEDADSIPGLGRSPRGGNGNPLQDSSPENPMERGAW